MVNIPFLPLMYSAAITAPNANPLRLCALCMISISSTADVYLMICVPGTSPSLTSLINKVSGLLIC
jgi:hypothetical protein